MHKNKKIIFIAGLIIIILFLVFSQVERNTLPFKSATVEIEKDVVEQITLTVIIGNETLKLASYTGQTFYDILLSAKESKQITFSGKNYPVLGFFVTDINSLHSVDNKNLIYYINNKEASVGVSSYFPQNGDVIEWKLE